MNFKSLAISAIVALSTFGGVAHAAPSTCALRDANDFTEFTCDHTIRTNANGHNINDITFFAEGTRYDLSVVVWSTDGVVEYAEMFTKSGRTVTGAYRAKNGSICIDNNDTQLCWFVS